MLLQLTKKALFPGESEIDQIFKIFQLLGTPNEDIWPGISNMSHYARSFPTWKPANLKDRIHFHDDEEEDFFKVFLLT